MYEDKERVVCLVFPLTVPLAYLYTVLSYPCLPVYCSVVPLPTCILFCRTLAYLNTVLSYLTCLPTCILFCRTLPACLPVYSSVVPYLLAYCILFCRTLLACLAYLYTVLSYPIAGRAFSLISRPHP